MTTEHAVKEYPILFTPENVRAILSGAKTQTRRIVKPQPPANCDTPMFDWTGHGWFYDGLDEDGDCHDLYPDNDTGLRCHYGKPGDHIWVRETLRRGDDNVWYYNADKAPVMVDPKDQAAMLSWAFHKEGNVCTAIHMPRWAARLILELTEVRVERVNAISREDALAEAVTHSGVLSEGYRHEGCATPHDSAQLAYRCIWDSINAKQGYPFDSGCWVWCLTFKRVQP